MRKKGQLMAPVHPGEILWEDFMKPLGRQGAFAPGREEANLAG